MITSEKKLGDIRHYEDILAVTEQCIKIYQKTADDGLYALIQRLYDWSQEVKLKIDAYNYPHS